MRTQSHNRQQHKPRGLILNRPDRRIARRYLLNWAMRIKELDQRDSSLSAAGELKNLSSTGAVIKLGRAVQAGARLEVLIQLPLKPEKWMRYYGKALRVQVADSRTEVAIRFDSARPAFV